MFPKIYGFVMQLFRHALSQHETDREETLRLIASLESHQAVPYRLLTKENLARSAAAARERRQPCR
jgi:hypothetical protein